MHCRLKLKNKKENLIYALHGLVWDGSTICHCGLKVRESACNTRAAWKFVLAEFGQNVPCVMGRRIQDSRHIFFLSSCNSRTSVSLSLSLSFLPFWCIANRYLYVHVRVTHGVIKNWRNLRSIYFRKRDKRLLNFRIVACYWFRKQLSFCSNIFKSSVLYFNFAITAVINNEIITKKQREENIAKLKYMT